MKSITDNILAAFISGTSSQQEDKLVINELANNEEFSDLLNVIDEVDSLTILLIELDTLLLIDDT